MRGRAEKNFIKDNKLSNRPNKPRIVRREQTLQPCTNLLYAEVSLALHYLQMKKAHEAKNPANQKPMKQKCPPN